MFVNRRSARAARLRKGGLGRHRCAAVPEPIFAADQDRARIRPEAA